MMLGCLFHPFVKADDRFLDEPVAVCRNRKEKNKLVQSRGEDTQAENISEAPGLTPGRICSFV